MQTAVPLACFLSLIRPPGVQYENALLQIAPVDKSKCPYIKDNNDVGFQLFTRHNPTTYQELILGDDEKLFASNMDYNDRTVIYFHAWMEQPDDGSGIMVREAYMQRGDTNVIMVDAHHLEAGPWYFTAAQNTWYIGRFAAQFIDYLASRGLNLNNTHLIGHSLGAHAAGVAGSALKSGRVARITGLDPALPLFEGLPLEQRLDTTDAHFVDIIHTDAGIFGYKSPMGHVDFYPNGGISPQPGCELEIVLPKQLLLNKCDGRTQTRGFYSYYLVANQVSHIKRKTLESKFENLFAYIERVKSNNSTDENNERGNDKKADVDITLKIDNNDTVTHRKDNSKETTPRNDKTTDKKHNDSIRDVITQVENTDTFEDQIAEASEYVITNVKYNQETLKEKETVSLIKESEEVMLQDAKTNGKDINSNREVANSNEETKRNDRDTTRFTLFDLEDTHLEDSTLKNTQHNIKYLNYKEPCESNDQKLIDKATEIKRDPKPKDRYKNLNILNILGNTYRLSRVLSTLKQIKHNDKTGFEKLKSLLVFKEIATTPTPERHVVKRQKRFLPFLRRNEEVESGNIIFRMLDFLIKNRKNVLPVFTVMREINTLVRSGNGELNHFTKEQNNYIGATPPTFTPISYSLELGNENRAVAFIKRILGMSPKGDRLSITGKK